MTLDDPAVPLAELVEPALPPLQLVGCRDAERDRVEPRQYRRTRWIVAYRHSRRAARVAESDPHQHAVLGDDRPVALLDRSWMEQLREEADPRRALEIPVSNSRDMFGRVAPIMRVVRDAAGSDPDMAAQWHVNQQQRVAAHRVLAEQLDAKHGLRAGLSANETTDVLFALISLEMYLLLTVERGWTPAQWERWITTTVGRARTGRAPGVAMTPEASDRTAAVACGA